MTPASSPARRFPPTAGSTWSEADASLQQFLSRLRERWRCAAASESALSANFAGASPASGGGSLTPVRITAENLACERGGRMVFTGISFKLGEGEMLQLTGPNGSGKSTLLKLLAGLVAQARRQLLG